MAEAKRETGIGVIGAVPWGTHFCQFYKTKEDLLSILVPYFKAGLGNNEFCMWVTSDPLNSEDAIAGLKKEVQDLDAYIERGQIEILDYKEWYTKTGKFEAGPVLQAWVEKEAQAIKNGFDGLRLSGNTFWLERKDWKKFADYEMAINAVIGKYKMLALCTYSLDKCDASDVIDVVSSHEFALIKKENKWERIESSEHKLKRAALHLNDVLRAANVINQIAIGGGDPKTFLDKACSALLGTREYCMAWIGLIEEGHKRVIPVASAGAHTDYLDHVAITWDESPTGCGPTGMALKTRQPQVCRNTATDPMFAPWRKEALQRGFASSAVVPMIHDGRLFGALSVYAKVPEYFSDEEVALLVALGKDIAVALRHMELEKLRLSAENALRESEDKFRSLFELSADLVVISDIDGYFRQINPAWSKTLGYSEEELLGKPYLNFVHPDDVDRTKKVVEEKLKRGDTVLLFENRYIRKDGGVAWLEWTSQPQVAKGYTFAIARDVTERKQSEMELRKIAWLLKPKVFPKETFVQSYGDPKKHNADPTILNMVGAETLNSIINDFMGLLETSAAVYEKNGDYAAGVLSSGWCRFLDSASLKLCNTPESKQALGCGKWCCHESCWSEVSKKAIANGMPTDMECAGGIRLYAVPIRLGKEIIGAINFGYGDPPKNPEKINEIAKKYKVDAKELTKLANDYETRPPFIIDLAKHRLEASANLIGVLVGRKRAELELEEFEKFFQISSDLMVIADPHGSFKKVNPACLKTLGYAEADLLTKPFVDFVHPDDRKPTLDEMARQIQSGSTLDFENRYICKDGTVRWLSWRASYDKDMEVTCATARDITERKKKDSEILAAALYARNLIEASLDPLVTISSDGKIADVNKATELVTGVPREQLIGQEFVNYFTEPEKAREGYKQVFLNGIVRDYPLTLRHTSGRTTDVLYNASVYKNDVGEVQGVFAAARDITERKRSEERETRAMVDLVRAEKMEAMKNMFIASMSHELRTPLNSIIGFTGILLMGLPGALNEEQKKQLGMIKMSSHHLLELINDVIDVSKIDAGMINFANDEFKVEEIIEEARYSVANAAKEKGLDVTIVVAGGLTMKGDRRRVKQIVLNLLSNAVKFTDRGMITVEAVREHDTVVVKVTDSGIGIKADDMAQLFKQFSRIITPGRAIQEGSGLGLYLSQKIAGMLGGEITAQSEFGKGSIFTLKLPMGI